MSRHPVQPSSRSLYTYFSKPVAPSPKPGAQAGEYVQKREPLKDAGGQFKKRAVERSPPAEITPLFDTSVIQDLPSASQLPSSSKSPCTVVVETQSRFFKVEATASSRMEGSRRSCTSRGDTGIGLDEAYLLDAPDAVGCLSEQDESLNPAPQAEQPLPPKAKCHTGPMLGESTTSHSTVPTPSDEDQLASEFKKAEAKVIQGWREKFSNISRTGAGRTSGLTRAAQASTSRSKQHVVGSSKTALAVQRHYPRQGIVRTTPGHPTYHLGAARRPDGVMGPTVPDRGTSRLLSSQRGPSTLHHGHANQAAPGALDAPCVVLDLDRFKYTPPVTAIATVHASAPAPASASSTTAATATSLRA